MKSFVRLGEHLIKNIGKIGEQYSNTLKNDAIYFPLKYRLSANLSPKLATNFSGIEHVESSNLSAELSKVDLVESIDTRFDIPKSKHQFCY